METLHPNTLFVWIPVAVGDYLRGGWGLYKGLRVGSRSSSINDDAQSCC